MTWTKIGDETFAFRAVRRLGAGAMGYWLALMTYSAREELDGTLSHEDIVDAWAPLIAGEVERSAAMLEALDLLDEAETLRERARLEVDRLVAHFIAALRGAEVLRKRRGSNSGYKLHHPNGAPYEEHQPTRVQRAAERGYERERSRLRREKRKPQLPGIPTESETTLGRDGFEIDLREGAPPPRGRERPDVSPDVAAALAEVPVDRPTLAAVDAAVAASKLPRGVALRVVAETATRAALGAANGKIRSPSAWLRAAIPKALHAEPGRIAETEHLKRTAHERRPRTPAGGGPERTGFAPARALLAALLS